MNLKLGYLLSTEIGAREFPLSNALRWT